MEYVNMFGERVFWPGTLPGRSLFDNHPERAYDRRRDRDRWRDEDIRREQARAVRTAALVDAFRRSLEADRILSRQRFRRRLLVGILTDSSERRAQATPAAPPKGPIAAPVLLVRSRGQAPRSVR